MKTPKIKGHALIITERNEAYSHGQAATYAGKCECGKGYSVWPDRLSVLRMKHRDHLKQVYLSAKEAKK